MVGAFTLCVQYYGCPKCGAEVGERCLTPKGRRATTPHNERVRQMSAADWEECRVRMLPVDQVMDQLVAQTEELGGYDEGYKNPMVDEEF